MSAPLLSLGLDVLILFFLVITIYYALKLSKNLNIFRRQRQEFENLIVNLNDNINQAQMVINEMKAETRSSGREMQELLDESRALVNELKLVNGAGNALAERLEGFSDRRGSLGEDIRPAEHPQNDDLIRTLRADHAPERREESLRPPSFFIQDRDFEDVEEEDFGSQAERDLYEALQGRKHKNM